MKRIIIFLIAALTLCACSHDEKLTNIKDYVDNLNITVVEKDTTEGATDADADDYFKTITSSYNFSQEEIEYINSHLKEIRNEVTDGYRIIVINYPSVDAQGNATTLSGSIFMSKNYSTFNEIVINCHQTATNDEGLSSAGGIGALEVGTMTMSHRTVIFSSDYLGFGSSASYFHPYMNQTLAARNSLDMLKAGLVYLKKNGYEMKTAAQGLKTYIQGYSQGGAVALATHRALEEDTDLCEYVNFKGSYCGAGPYNLRTTMNYFFTQDEMSIPFVLPYVMMGMFESYPDEFKGIDCYDYLSDKCKSCNLIEFMKSKPGLQELNTFFSENIGMSINDVLSPEAQDLNSDIMQVMFRCLDRQNLLDGSWQPRHPILFYHSNEDDVVSYENTVEAMKVFSKSGYADKATNEVNKSHVLEYIHYILTLGWKKYRVD